MLMWLFLQIPSGLESTKAMPYEVLQRVFMKVVSGTIMLGTSSVKRL